MFACTLTSIIPLPNPRLFSVFLPGTTKQMDLWIQQNLWSTCQTLVKAQNKKIPDLMEFIF